MMKFEDIQQGAKLKVWKRHKKNHPLYSKSGTVVFKNKHYFTIQYKTFAEAYHWHDVQGQIIRVEETKDEFRLFI